MNSIEIQSLFWGLLGGAMSIAGTAIGFANWLNNRFDTIKTRQHETDAKLQIAIERLRSVSELESNREMSHFDLLEYKTNANRELIEHRTTRFMAELQSLEKRLCVDIEDLKGYLSKTTDFKIKGEKS